MKQVREQVSGDDLSAEFDYLCVDAFAADIFTARALQTAFEIGLIDFLLEKGTVAFEETVEKVQADDRGMALLVDLLAAGGIVCFSGRMLSLTPLFLEALSFRKLLEVKLEASLFGARDMLDHFTDMIVRPADSLQKIKFRELFAYGKAIQ